MITVMMGGRAAETMVFNEMTAGAASDIQKATDVARSMVVELGMSKLGPINWGPQVDERMRFIEPVNVSPSMQDKIDREVSSIVEGCYTQAAKILRSTRLKLKSVADALVKVETLDREEFEKIVGGKIRVNKAALATVRA
jgi:cell division protease FtsH